MSADKSGLLSLRARRCGRKCVRGAYATANTASFLAMTFYVRHAACKGSTLLPFQWQMLLYMVVGYTCPLLIIVAGILIKSLFWNQEKLA